MPRDEASVRDVVVAAIATYAGLSVAEIDDRVALAAADGDTAAAGPDTVKGAIAEIVRRVRMAPISAGDRKAVLASLDELPSELPLVSRAEVAAWEAVLRAVPPTIVEIDRDPIVLPTMSAGQEASWRAVLALEVDLRAHWCLIGGQMVALICAEHNHTVTRSTEDADIVLGVWIERNALDEASRLLHDQGFEETATSDGYGYRYQRGDASVDLMVPENVSGQAKAPTTATRRPGLEVDGGNQALTRAERVPVLVEGHAGYVRRPNMLGAIVAKAAASVVDSRDRDRHRDDFAVLGRIALDNNMYREMREIMGGSDRGRLQKALRDMPAGHRSWRVIDEPGTVRDALTLLAAGPTT